MYYYQKNIGDYAKKAGRLTILQHGIYNLLIDSCYDRESFPMTVDDAVDWVWASSQEEIEGVEFVLKKFFEFDDQLGFVQKRILEEIEEYRAVCKKNSTNGKKGGRPKKNPDGNKNNPVGLNNNPDETDRKPVGSEIKPNQEPLTTNHKPITNLKESAWAEWITFRKLAKLKPYKTNAKAKALAKYSHEIQQQAVDHSIENEYAGLFPEKFAKKSKPKKPTSKSFDIASQDFKMPEGLL